MNDVDNENADYVDDDNADDADDDAEGVEILTGSLTTGIPPAASSSQTRWASW